MSPYTFTSSMISDAKPPPSVYPRKAGYRSLKSLVPQRSVHRADPPKNPSTGLAACCMNGPNSEATAQGLLPPD